ncbi:hypothetical protein LJR074_002155 [Acidovorax sp. LjRoot74]|uniref:hypothetical protein n=1 Tax=Acidovorax sp. LjRoot74 TaxID=3342337 RepID=UPI003ECC4B0B
MTPQEHEALQLKMKNLAQQTLIKWLADLWRARLAITPEPERSMTLAAMEAKLQGGAKEYSDLTIPWLDAASSDMQAAMFQEAYEEVSKQVMATARAGLTPEEEAKFRAAAAAGFPSINR